MVKVTEQSCTNSFQPLSPLSVTSEGGHSNRLAILNQTCCIHGDRCTVAIKHLQEEISTQESNASSSVAWPLEKVLGQQKFYLKKYYIGIRSKRSAEYNVTQKATFKLYHSGPQKPNLAHLNDQLNLYICYRTSIGNYCHYQIREIMMIPTENAAVPYYFVDYGNNTPPTFPNLIQLIHYYNTYHHARRSEAGTLMIDTFPWWEKIIYTKRI